MTLKAENPRALQEKALDERDTEDKGSWASRDGSEFVADRTEVLCGFAIGPHALRRFSCSDPTDGILSAMFARRERSWRL